MTRIGPAYNSTVDPPFMVLPVVYDTSNNQTTLAEKREAPNPTTALYHACVHVKRYNEYNMPLGDCSIKHVIQDFLRNFTLPSEPQAQVKRYHDLMSNKPDLILFEEGWLNFLFLQYLYINKIF